MYHQWDVSISLCDLYINSFFLKRVCAEVMDPKGEGSDSCNQGLYQPGRWRGGQEYHY